MICGEQILGDRGGHPFQVVYFAVCLSEIPSARRLLLLTKIQERSGKFPGRFFVRMYGTRCSVELKTENGLILDSSTVAMGDQTEPSV